MSAAAAAGALATLMSTAFCLSTLERYRRRRRAHELAWTVSMAMFALASLSYFLAAGMGWGPFTFRSFYLFGAILNVPYLALGTVYLLAGERHGDRVRRALNLSAAFCAGIVLTAPIGAPLDVPGIPSGKEVFGVGPRVMAAVGSGVASVVLVGGAVWSTIGLLRLRRTQADTMVRGGVTPGRLAVTNVLIALGTVILGTGGAFFTTGDTMVDFGIWLAVGVTVLFAGFLVSNPSGTTERSPYWQELHDLVRTGQPEPTRA
ncbi:MAG: hypothetical protein ACKO04_11365 [Actinomycetes bacterium]